jgi:hypothetical protein
VNAPWTYFFFPVGPDRSAVSSKPTSRLPPALFHAEQSLVTVLRSLLAAGHDRLPAFQSVEWDQALGWLRARTGADLAPGQADAVKLALTEKVAVLTGGPGCGKRRWCSPPGPLLIHWQPRRAGADMPIFWPRLSRRSRSRGTWT